MTVVAFVSKRLFQYIDVPFALCFDISCGFDIFHIEYWILNIKFELQMQLKSGQRRSQVINGG